MRLPITPAMIILSSFMDPSNPEIEAAPTRGLTVNLFNDGSCTGGKLPGWYVKGICYSTQGNRGMTIENTRHHPCYLTVYKGDGCSSDDTADLNTKQCWEIGNRGSFKITCSS
ncbi:hypothetical protein CDEST_07751 [Colletotrichum destructivum]|uniref:Secreted protein n=1 Tax=Colletotrichum destructivum TaxID=34406 RepID=A0AAX4IH37_9PEZI|nr:hypothetical protein CDEST_07751 [Colletotrichum destructivum]